MELVEGQKFDLNGEVWGNKENILVKWNKLLHCLQCHHVFLTRFVSLSVFLVS